VIAEGAWFIAEPDELGNPDEDMRARLTMARAGRGLVLVAESTAGRMVLRGPPRVPLGWIVVDVGEYRRTRHVGRLEVMVASRARGAGVGRALVEAAIAACGGVGVRRLSLAVYAHNTRARALYAALGFVEEGQRVGEYRMPDGAFVDDVLMARVVGQAGSR
jgi:ribosomal protein S18 acetylase RimI-like enzyme